MPFSDILLKSLKYPWKNRALWIMGLLFGLFSSLGNITNNIDSTDIDRLSQNIDPAVLAWGFGVMAVLILVSIFLTIWFQIGMTQGAITADSNKPVKIKEALKVKKGAFWGLVLLQILIPLALIIAASAIVAIVAFGCIAMPKPAGMIVGVVLGVAAVLALIPTLVYLGLVWNLATRYVVVDSKKAVDSLKEGRNILKGSGWLTLGFSIILGMITGSASFFAMLPFLIFVLATVFFASQSWIVAAVISGILALLGLVLFLAVAGYFQASSMVGHTLWWKELKKLKKA